jgi:hypothetical protein
VLHRIDALESRVLTWGLCADDISILMLSVPGELTRGSAEERQGLFLDGMRRFPESMDPAWLDEAEQISKIRVAPETTLRGFFRDPVGPGWALVGEQRPLHEGAPLALD